METKTKRCVATNGNGPTLWDCKCPDCRKLQQDWQDADGSLD